MRKSESEVFHRFAELTSGKNGAADFAPVFDGAHGGPDFGSADGKIVEEGPHDQLMQAGGRYAEMFELQAANYR